MLSDLITAAKAFTVFAATLAITLTLFWPARHGEPIWTAFISAMGG